jgi:peptidoglycan/xylan/chitin deacetylase (PgdA/CDA1 family)
LKNLLQSAERWITSLKFRHVVPLVADYGVVSFSFDDAPKSACYEGRSIIEKYRCHATWYVAGGLTDKIDQGHRCHSFSDISDLFHNGHQIGCHTFSHKACDSINRIELMLEFQKNCEFLNQIGLSDSEIHFSFPFGAYNLASKKIAAHRFKSSRITGGGFHVDYADLNALKAERLYQGVMTVERLNRLMKEVAAKKAWMILYTHDVSRKPSEWGCTENLLDYALQAALTSGCKVMPVDRAIQYVSGKGP